jgi:hypothetical protein
MKINSSVTEKRNNMRHWINLFSSILTESRGLGARKPGEEFIGTQNPNDKIYVDSVEFYPNDKLQYASAEETAAELKRVTAKLRNATVNLVGKFKSNDLAFGVATFLTPDKQKLVFIKPFQRVSPDPTQNSWSNQTGIPGYRYNSKVAAKSQAGMMPQDILTKPSDLTPKDIVSQIAAKFGNDSSLTKVAQAVANGQSFPITINAPDGVSFSAFTNYFCELLHPISLVVGTAEGNANEAAVTFMGPAGFNKTLISFGVDKTEGLSDSIITNKQGAKIKVSSKAAAGAEASAKNLLDLSREFKGTPTKSQREVLDIIETVTKMGQRNAPLVLGKKFNIISERDEADILDMYQKPLVSMEDVQRMKLSKNLKNLLQKRVTANPDSVNLYFHAIAAVAHGVAKHINDNTDFSKVASELLNEGALIQVYTKARDKGDVWVVEKFIAQWPSKTVTGVKFSAEKTYYSTGINGNFTFKILRGSAQDTPDETQTDVEQAISAAPKQTNVLPTPGARAKIAPVGKAAGRATRGAAGIGRAKR